MRSSIARHASDVPYGADGNSETSETTSPPRAKRSGSARSAAPRVASSDADSALNANASSGSALLRLALCTNQSLSTTAGSGNPRRARHALGSAATAAASACFDAGRSTSTTCVTLGPSHFACDARITSPPCALAKSVHAFCAVGETRRPASANTSPSMDAPEDARAAGGIGARAAASEKEVPRF